MAIATASILISPVGGVLRFFVCVAGDDDLNRTAMFTLPPIGGEIINQIYGYDSAEGFHFLLVQKTKQKSTLKTYGLKNPLMPTPINDTLRARKLFLSLLFSRKLPLP